MFFWYNKGPVLPKLQIATANLTTLWEALTHAMDRVRGLEYLDPTTDWMGSEILIVIMYLNLFTSPLRTQITGVTFFQSYYIYSRAHIYKDCAKEGINSP